MPSISADKLTGIQCFDHPIRKMPNRPFTGTESFHNPINYSCANKGISLDRKG
jgi:hypothetical protein|tara:strand:+ start:65 stop:223 length:159 start_codon:yes stop_codon:yes gene_type:complete